MKNETLLNKSSIIRIKEGDGGMKIFNLDLFIGFSWIIVAFISTLRVGLESILLWLATIMIWSYILRISLQKEEEKKDE